MRATRAIVAGAVLTSLLTGCSGDPYEDYCQAVSDNQKQLSEIYGAGGASVLLKALPTFRDLQGEAPDDIRDDWKVVVTALTGMEKALSDADLDPTRYGEQDLPTDLTVEEKDRILAAGEQLAAPAFEAAMTAVEQQARDVCHTPLHL